MITVPLSQGKVAIIDDCDAHLLRFRWHAQRQGLNWYARRLLLRSEGHFARFMHREILGVSDRSVEVDHVNGDGLDNRRSNLRSATRQQNAANQRKPSTNTSGFKGVTWHAKLGKWRASLMARGHRHYLGLHATAEAAARAYDAAAVVHFGEFASLNFPTSSPGSQTP